MSTTYYCWACDAQANHAVPVAPHYEDPRRIVRFCSFEHRADYLGLAAL